MTTPIIITAAGKDLRFTPDLSTYNKYINEMMPHDKVSPATNYLRRIVHKDDKAHLDEVLKMPSALMRILAKVNEAFEGDLEIEVKKLLRHAKAIESNGLEQALALKAHYLPNQPDTTENLARALWLDKHNAEIVANGIALAFSNE